MLTIPALWSSLGVSLNQGNLRTPDKSGRTEKRPNNFPPSKSEIAHLQVEKRWLLLFLTPWDIFFPANLLLPNRRRRSIRVNKSQVGFLKLQVFGVAHQTLGSCRSPAFLEKQLLVVFYGECVVILSIKVDSGAVVQRWCHKQKSGCQNLDETPTKPNFPFALLCSFSLLHAFFIASS